MVLMLKVRTLPAGPGSIALIGTVTCEPTPPGSVAGWNGLRSSRCCR